MQSEYVDDPDEMLREAREADEARREYDRLQDAFYAESIGWSNADKRRDYAAMLNHIRAGIATTLPFIESRRTPEYNDWMPWIPWFLPKSGVVLALYNATELLDNVERLKDVLGSEGIEAATYREMAARFEDIRRFVQAEGETSLEALKTAIPSVGADTHRLVDWLGKNRELSYWKGDDGKALIRWGRPTEAPREAGRAFRAGSKSVVAPNVDISFSRAPLGTDDWYHSVLTEQPALTSWERMLEAPRAFRDSRLLPAEDRLPGIMRNVAVGAESWLIGRAKRASDASHRTAVIVKAADGKTVTGLTLDHKAHRVGASVDGDHLVTIDERLILRVIHASQAEVLRISLEHTPEVQETVQREWNPDGDLPDVTAFDVNVPAKQLVYAIEGRVYRFGFDGRLISAFEVPLRPSYDAWWGEHGAPTKIAAVLDRIGRSTNITGRQAASIVPNLPFGRRNQPEVEAAMVAAGAHRGKAITKREQGGVWRLANLMGQLAPDTVRRLRFSGLDDTLFVLTYSGLMLKMTPGGSVLESWLLPARPDAIIEKDDGTLLVASNATLASVRAAETPKVLHGLNGESVLTKDILVKRAGRTIVVLDLASTHVESFTIGQDFRASYATRFGAVVESTSSAYEICLR